MSLAPWTLLEEQAVVKDRWIDLRRQRCRTPAGVELADYYVQHPRDWVMVAAVTPEGRFLRVRQWRQGAGTISLEFPGGVVDPDEGPEVAAARELLEETGFAGDPPVLLQSLWPNPASQANRMHVVLITGCRRVAAPAPDPTEAFELDEADAATVLADLRSGVMAHALHHAVVMALQLHRPALLEGGA